VLLFIVKSLKQSAVTAIKWNAIGQFGNNFLNFTFSIILARLLSPADFGLVTLVFVVTEVSNVFIESGFASGLIQSKNVTEIDFSTIYVFNILVGLLFSIFSSISSGGFFAAFYEDTRLVNITKAISVIYIINSFSIVPKAYLTRKMDFKPQTFIGLVTSSVTGALGISLAFAGFGYWALVLKRLCESILNTLGYIFVSKWKISFRFSLMSLKKYWRYSSNILFHESYWKPDRERGLCFCGKLYPRPSWDFILAEKPMLSYRWTFYHPLLTELFSHFSQKCRMIQVSLRETMLRPANSSSIYFCP